MSATAYDVIVVGLGAMGSAAVYQLALRGASVLGIDRYDPPHTLGSTHGDTRITRQAIGEGIAYVPLALRSHELWRRIERESGESLLTACGALVLGRPGAGATHRGKTGFLDQTIAAATAFAIPHEVLDSAQVARRFPQFRLAGDEVGYLEPGAGFLRPEACVRAQLRLAAGHGADVHTGELVVAFEATPAGVTVRTDHGEYRGGRLVLSAGPWLPTLVEPAIACHFAVYRQTMHWFATDPPLAALTPDRFPVFIWEVDEQSWFYGFPAIDGPEGGMKVASEQYRNATDPDAVEREVSIAESQALYESLVGARLPDLRRDRAKAVSCLYTATRDGDFVIDRLPGADSVVLVSPCSGHGFKHSAAVGEAVAQTVLDGQSTIDLSAFSLARLQG